MRLYLIMLVKTPVIVDKIHGIPLKKSFRLISKGLFLAVFHEFYPQLQVILLTLLGTSPFNI